MKSIFNIKWGCLLFFLGLTMQTYSQEELWESKAGIVVYSPYFKNFAVLMQDSSKRWCNRFLTEVSPDSTGEDYSYKYLPFLYIDSALFYECERRLINRDPSVRFHYSDGRHCRHLNFIYENIFRLFLNRYIRLYVGYIDENNEKVVCVQFITLREFKEDEWLYNYSVDFTISDGQRARVAHIRLGNISKELVR